MSQLLDVWMRFVSQRKARKGSGLANAATGSLPLREELSWQHKTWVCTQTKRLMHTIQPGISYIFCLSQMDGTNVLSFFHQSQSALLCVCGVTRSLEMALAPSSQRRNHLVEWQTHTHIFNHVYSTGRLEGFELHLGKRFSHKFFYSSTRSFLCPEHTLTHIQKYTCTEIPFCQLSAPDHVTIKDSALQLNTASKSQGKESWENHLFLSSMRDHTGEEGGLRQIG